MSRVGQAPISIPSGVEVTVEGSSVAVSGPKGKLSRTIHPKIKIEVGENEVRCVRTDEARQTRALHGLTRALVNNMVVGVTDGYEKVLEIVGVGYRASAKGNGVELLLGFSHPVTYEPPEGVEFEIPNPTRIVVRGVDKEVVGQVAAEIRKFRPPEPYKGKGIRYEGEYILRKAGKTGAT